MATFTHLFRRRPSSPGLSIVVLGAGLALALLSDPLYAREVSSSARVNEDGSLRISGKTIHLFGVHLPNLDRTCNTRKRPTYCGSRAAVALDFKINGFVRCELLDEQDDGSYTGRCYVDSSHFNAGEDLSAYLLERGWAVALPDAPVEYQALEKIARSRQVGIWGTPVDRVAPAQR